MLLSFVVPMVYMSLPTRPPSSSAQMIRLLMSWRPLVDEGEHLLRGLEIASVRITPPTG